jgi:hypothetical protein
VLIMPEDLVQKKQLSLELESSVTNIAIIS